MVTPCEYVFPIFNLDQALRSSATHTDNVLGALPDAQAAFIANGDAELVPLIGSIIGQYALPVLSPQSAKQHQARKVSKMATTAVSRTSFLPPTLS